jgi:hypothetical protein
MPDRKARATFVEPMLLLRTEKLPEGKDWLYEIFLRISAGMGNPMKIRRFIIGQRLIFLWHAPADDGTCLFAVFYIGQF